MFRFRCILLSCLLQAKTFSYLCRIFYIRKVLVRQVIYIPGYIEKCWCKYFYLVKTLIMLVGLSTQNAWRIYRIFFISLTYPNASYFFHFISWNGWVFEISIWVLCECVIFFTRISWNVSHSEKLLWKFTIV